MRIWALVSVAWSPDCGRREPGVSRAAAIYAGSVSWESEGGRGVDGRAQGRAWRCRASCAGCTRGSGWAKSHLDDMVSVRASTNRKTLV